MRTTKLPALALTMSLVLSIVAPGALIGQAAAADTTSIGVETDDPTSVTATSATLNGNLTELSGADNASVFFRYWEAADPSTNTTTDTQRVESTGPFSTDVTDLEPNTTYVVQAHAEANDTDTTGAEVMFTTAPSDPAPLGVETLPASDVTDDSATLNGELTGVGGADNATVWFEYWIAGDAANTTNTSESTLEDPGEFSEPIDGLDNDTRYEYVAYARANATTVSGDVDTFTTDAHAPEAPKNFGLQVSDFIYGLLDGGIDDDKVFGQLVTQFVIANNPGADTRPEHAGPPWLDDTESPEPGPPDHAGPNDEADKEDVEEDEDDEGAEETEDDAEAAEDDEGKTDEDEDDDDGPPEHAGPDDDS